ncbi:homoserine O-succinyltransferase [Bacillus sp. AFS055030]|uniref:homoserine O-acetyltransferase MetA n=1 Tax=Bacillus sp. AFS055030 TaxID=2033507 RepID=UPI000BFC4AB5|nr:homoserine O-succinyltransferase [Bacillus sp. AFS055030]PGL70140.1 homoserine O-succinyltransferase [Bacillus sp. AFS055030]
MPVIINQDLPATEILTKENVFYMTKERAESQDIRPLQIGILNLMPTKIETETQLLRLIANSPLQVEVDLIGTESYKPKNVSEEHVSSFYKTISQIQNSKYDGFIITGAPVETMEYEEVEYWSELKEIMDYTKENVTSTLHICWGAQAGLYHHYGVPKYTLDQKMFGVFPHSVEDRFVKLVRGFDDEYYVPHSRHTEVRKEDIDQIGELKILSLSDDAGVHLVTNEDGKQIFATGHHEYCINTLKSEYERDVQRGAEIAIPKNYFRNDNPKQPPIVRWRSHANLLFSNWLNYYVYQETPYNL